MSKNILNAYAIKAFSEHPTALWPLDDDVFFLSLISGTYRQFTNWTKTMCTAIEQGSGSYISPETLSPFGDDGGYSMIQASGMPAAIMVSNITANGTLITYTTTAAHGLTVGQYVTIIGAVPSQFSKQDVVIYSTPTTTSFTIQSTDTGTYISGGEVRYNLTIQAITPTVFNNASLDFSKGSFCVNQYIYQDSVYVNWYEIGYSYVDASSVTHEVISRINTSQNGSWINFNYTHPLSSDTPTSFKLIFRVNVSTGGVNSDYRFYMNGLSVGQWSEVASSRSLGATQTALPPSSGVTGNGVTSDQYGILSNNAYYVTEGTDLLAKNESTPMVFGTETLTKIFASATGRPSLIFPGMGMLNEVGRYKNQTLEFWLRISPNTKNSRRIIGPINGDYGVYVRDNTIVLLIGDAIIAHYVAQWYRPMLIHFVMNDSTASLMINGERVGEIEIERSSLSLPNAYNELDYGPDWWGVYSYSDIDKFDIDCISIYPYVMSDQVAKKRFVWGQGTPSITSINNQYLGTSILVDYSNANYSVNAIYPDAFNWGGGYFNNLSADKYALSTPEYQLPEVYIEGRTIEEWYSANNLANDLEYPNDSHEKFVTFRPNTTTRTNLVINPSFETNSTGWGTTGTGTTITRISTDSYDGTTCLQVTHGTSITSGVIHSAGLANYSAVTAGKEYTLSAYCKIPTGQATETLNAVIVWYTSANAQLTTSVGASIIVTAADGWKRVYGTFTAPATAAYARISIQRRNTAVSGDKFLVDAIMLETGNLLKYYFDGDFSTSASWNGTANASTSKISAWTPSGDNWNGQSYLYFENLNILTDPLSAIYGIFEISKATTEEQMLFLFKNSISGSTFTISVIGSTIYYKLNGVAKYIYSININEHFAVGINIQNLATYFGNTILDFFGYPAYIQLYVGGNGIKTFEGKIYKIGFSNQYNYQEISNYFMNNGVVINADVDTLMQHYASYTLEVLDRFNRLFLDISVSSQWEEFYPLSYFAKRVYDDRGNQYYDLDMLQVNIDYTPISSVSDGNIDFSKSSLRTYLTFQSLVSGANDPISSYPITEALPQSKVIDAMSLAEFDAYNRKFEFCDNTIIFPPKTVNFENIAMTVYFDIKQEGILTSPIAIKNFEIASNAFDDNNFKAIGTRYGVDVYPYKKDGLYYTSKKMGAFTIYKKNTPYLYLTKNSGLRMITPPTDNVQNGFSIPINKSAINTTIGAIQLWMKYEESFPTTAVRVFDINGKNQTIEFVVVSDVSGKRGVMYARDAFTKSMVTSLKFYQNGVYTNNPIIFQNEWACIGISFDDVVDMSQTVGAMNLYGGVTFNNISYYLANGLGRNENTIVRPWLRILEDSTIYDAYVGSDKSNYFNLSNQRMKWNYWYTDIGDVDNNILSIHRKWANVYLINQDPSYIVTPEDIYAAFTGTNINIVDDDRGMSLSNDKLLSIDDVTWSTFVGIPA